MKHNIILIAVVATVCFINNNSSAGTSGSKRKKDLEKDSQAENEVKSAVEKALEKEYLDLQRTFKAQDEAKKMQWRAEIATIYNLANKDKKKKLSYEKLATQQGTTGSEVKDAVMLAKEGLLAPYYPTSRRKFTRE